VETVETVKSSLVRRNSEFIFLMVSNDDKREIEGCGWTYFGSFIIFINLPRLEVSDLHINPFTLRNVSDLF
jgi:hypothetical protein